jgi:hypothetical protein
MLRRRIHQYCRRRECSVAPAAHRQAPLRRAASRLERRRPRRLRMHGARIGRAPRAGACISALLEEHAVLTWAVQRQPQQAFRPTSAAARWACRSRASRSVHVETPAIHDNAATGVQRLISQEACRVVLQSRPLVSNVLHRVLAEACLREHPESDAVMQFILEDWEQQS